MLRQKASTTKVSNTATNYSYGRMQTKGCADIEINGTNGTLLLRFNDLVDSAMEKHMHFNNNNLLG